MKAPRCSCLAMALLGRAFIEVRTDGAGGRSVNRSIALLAGLALGVAPQFAHGAPKPQPKDAKVWAAAEQARPEQLKLLEQAVDIDSGTGDVDGGRKVAALLAPQLKALGFSIESVPAEAQGLPENVVATLSGTGKGRILLIGH